MAETAGGLARPAMKPRPPLPGGPYLVVGLARSGVAAALALRARGEEVIGCDAGASTDSALARAAGRLSEAGVEVHLDASGDAIAARARTLIKSPGVPANAPVVAAARARGMPVLGEVELAWRLVENEFVAVTGTNGKTTTTEWIGHIHREAALPVAVVGNVGTPATSLAGELAPDRPWSARCRRFSSRTPTRSRPRRRCCSTSSPTILTVTARSTSTWRRS